jgi:hypothetical protein
MLCKTTALHVWIFRREVLKKVHNTVFCQDQSAVLGPILPVGEEQATSVLSEIEVEQQIAVGRVRIVIRGQVTRMR